MATTRDVTVTMRYNRRYIGGNPYVPGQIVPEGEPLFGILNDRRATPAEFKKFRHEMTETRDMRLVDARGIPGGIGAWDLDKNGFCIVRPPPPMDFTKQGDPKKTTLGRVPEDSLVKKEYFPKLMEMAMEITGAEKGFLFQHFNRSENPENAGLAYSRFTHSDAGPDSPESWRRLLVKQAGWTEAEAWNCEILYLNFWVPRDRPAFKDPLVLLDGATVNFKEEVVSIRSVMRNSKKNREADPNAPEFVEAPNRTGLVGPTYSPKHRWVYCSDMRPDEMWLFKQYDTREGPDWAVKQAFHDSFHDPHYDDTSGPVPGRRSAELRALLTFPKGTKIQEGSSRIPEAYRYGMSPLSAKL